MPSPCNQCRHASIVVDDRHVTQPRSIWRDVASCHHCDENQSRILALIFITPLSLLIVTASSSVPTSAITMERSVDTLLGISIAIAVLLGSNWLMTCGEHRLPARALARWQLTEIA